MGNIGNDLRCVRLGYAIEDQCQTDQRLNQWTFIDVQHALLIDLTGLVHPESLGWSVPHLFAVVHTYVASAD